MIMIELYHVLKYLQTIMYMPREEIDITSKLNS